MIDTTQTCYECKSYNIKETHTHKNYQENPIDKVIKVIDEDFFDCVCLDCGYEWEGVRVDLYTKPYPNKN